MSTSIALFGTSADPPTIGHKKILEELSNIYSCIVTYASDNPKKKHKENIFFRKLLLETLIKDINNPKINLTSEKDPILCNHCKRTASNGVRCLGMCVADNDY